MNDLKKLVFDLIRKGDIDVSLQTSNSRVIKSLFREADGGDDGHAESDTSPVDLAKQHQSIKDIQDTEEVIEESLSLADKEVEMIKKALEKYNGKRKMAANELGISERTLYRKIKEYGIDS
jgi:transcriptional regulator with PAS, ATPase and Fis domain